MGSGRPFLLIIALHFAVYPRNLALGPCSIVLKLDSSDLMWWWCFPVRHYGHLQCYFCSLMYMVGLVFFSFPCLSQIFIRCCFKKQGTTMLASTSIHISIHYICPFIKSFVSFRMADYVLVVCNATRGKRFFFFLFFCLCYTYSGP